MNLGALKRSIRFKILSGILILELLMVIVYSGIVYASTQSNLAINAKKDVERSQGAYNLILQGDTKMLSAALDSLATNELVRQTYVAHQDRLKLLATVQDLFQENKARYGITHLYFIDKDGTCFLRGHAPEIFGDTIQRDTFQQARAAGKTMSGIELGKTAFALRVVSPLIHNGILAGYMEFGEEIDHFNQLVKRETGIDVSVLVDKQYLDEGQYRKTLTAAGKPDNWDDIKGYTLVSTTLPDTKAAASLVTEDELRKALAPDYLGTVSKDSRSFAKGAFPLKDAAGKQVGVVLTLSDVTDQVRNARSALLFLILATALVFVVSFIVTARYLRAAIIVPLVHLTEQAKEISMGNVELKLETDREDEIGLLIQSFERMRVSLKKSLSLLTGKT